MRWSRFIALAAPAGLALSSVAFAQVRVDVNGQMVNDNPNPGIVGTPNLPINWTSYTTGSGGGMAGRWDTGGSSDSFGIRKSA